MCHGTFDLVHPGHIRHLMYAKSKADILVASLTCDAHISKANYPAVRAAAAAGDESRRVRGGRLRRHRRQPDAVSRTSRSSSPTTSPRATSTSTAACIPGRSEEIDVLETYGGEIIFTPGDVVFSSSRFIEQTPPNLAAEKLRRADGVGGRHLRRRCERRWSGSLGIRVHVVGDTIVDSYTYCTLIGGMTKTPTFSLKHETQVDYAGGAAIVAKHLREAGAEVTLLDGPRRRRAEGLRARTTWRARRRVPCRSSTHAADDAEERLHRRRLPHAQGRQARQPADLRQDRRTS